MEEEKCFTLDQRILLPVRDQGRCQCCYAIVGTACVSSLLAAEGWPLIGLSVQELVDWLHIYYPPKNLKKDKEGCYPNNNDNTFRFINTYGASLEELYCTGEQGRKGKQIIIENNMKVRISGFHKVDESWKEEHIKSQIEYQPLAGVVEVYPSFKKLKGEDIYKGPESGEELEGLHGIQVIGYGVENGIKYYKILNSWGNNWGNNGIAKVRRDLVTRLSFPYGASVDKELASYVRSKIASTDQEDSSTTKGNGPSSVSEKKSDKPSSSSSKEKGYDKTKKTRKQSNSYLLDTTIPPDQARRKVSKRRIFPG